MTEQTTIDSRSQGKKKGRAKDIDLHIGERLKQIRKQKNMTQDFLAEKLGVSFQQIQKYENGKNRISFSSMVELSQLLKVTLDSFIAGFGETDEGLSDNNQSHLVTQKETDELLRVYYSLDDPKLRKNLLKLVKSMADNIKD